MGDKAVHVEYSKRAVKTIGGMDRPTKQRIKKAVEGIPQGDIVELQGTKGIYRLRVGAWRVIFEYLSTDKVLVSKIAPRGGVYKGA